MFGGGERWRLGSEEKTSVLGPSALGEVIKHTDSRRTLTCRHLCVQYQEFKVNRMCACPTTEQAALGFYLLK